ncbi:MAG: YihY/virulence factor BrkB family protein [Bacilli bacterium]|nr:YihY/virulence factor BrkB family protein [Bacilli bacterium]
MQSFINKCRNYIKKVYEISRKPVVSVLPGHLSFFLLLSIIPILLLIAIISNTFSIFFNKLFDFVILSMPANTSELLEPLFNFSYTGFGVFIIIISAIFLASRGTKAIIITANNIYNVKKRTLQDILKSLLLTIILLLFFIFLIIILILGEKILSLILQVSPNGFITSNLVNLINILKWPASLVIMFFILKIIYSLSPNKKLHKGSVNKGSVFSTIMILLFTYLYSFYVTNYASYDDIYGTASSIIILLLWIYSISQIFVYGMIINSIEENKIKE